MIETTKQTVSNKDILKLIETRENTYLNDPLQIVADYNNENKNITDYVGRQLLEMIQNANDECENTFKEKKILIKLEENTLIIANNGNPFSKGGVESLMYSDLSPKVNEDNKVGQKGLGFRSVLNWADEIYISSYDLNIKFSKNQSISFLERLIKRKPEIRERLAEKTKEKHPISILRCPVLEEETSLKKAPEYDTVVELSLKKGAEDEIIKQIEKELIPEIIVFLHKVEEIEVLTNELHFSIKKITEDNFIVVERENFITNEKEEWTWYILDEEGVLEGKKGVNKNYDLKIAYNPDIVPNTQKLYTYFRTKVDFPYPVLAHGTFELNSNRNELSEDEDGYNELLVAKLANLLVECSLKLTESKVSSYNALKLLIPLANQHSSLYQEPWGFRGLINNYINTSYIFPTVTNEYIRLEDNIRFYEVEIEHLIPENHLSDFNTLLKSTSDKDISTFIKEGYENYSYSDERFTELLNNIINVKGFNLEQQIEWINTICDNLNHFYKEKDPVLPNLLINTENNIIITGEEEVILPPKGEPYKLPGDIKIQFVQKELTEKLKESISGDIRDLSVRLKVFGVDEYSMTIVARKIIVGTHKLLKVEGNNTSTLVKEMHKVLFHIFGTFKDELEKRDFIQNVPSPYLISRGGNLKTANELYFGTEYKEGLLSENLLGPLEKDLFIGSIEQNGISELVLEGSTYSLEKYLSWIGVANTPRRVIKEKRYSNVNRDYINHLFENLTYPYAVPYYGDIFNSFEEISSTFNHEYNILWFDHFEEIIKKAPFEYVLAWFIKDREINNCIVSDNEHTGARVSFGFGHKRNSRELDQSNIKSFILYYLKTQEFVPIENGNYAKPIDCISSSSNLSPLVKAPLINLKSDVFRVFNIKEDQINLLLNRLGVKENFKDLSLRFMYQLLNVHHKDFKNKPSSSSVLYNAIIEATANEAKKNESNLVEQEEYFENGQILVKEEGKVKYVQVNEATYVLHPNHSQDLLSKLKVAVLPLRVGNKRILELFGVQPIDYVEFSVKNVKKVQLLNQNFEKELEQIKPILFVYRQKKNLTSRQYKRELDSLKQLKIEICFDIEVEYILNGRNNKLELKNYEYVFDKVDKTYYIKLDNKLAEFKDLKTKIRFVETVADIISGSIVVTDNRKDFMLLLGQPQNNWKEMMIREFPDYLELEKEVMKNFEGALTSQQIFWMSVLNASSIEFDMNDLRNEKEIFRCMESFLSWDEFFDIYRSLDYFELSEFKNFKHIFKLFKNIKIDIKDFNFYSNYELNFKSYWSNKLVAIHNDLFDKYASLLHSKGFSSTFSNDLEKFKNLDLNLIIFKNSIFVNVEELYIQFLLKQLSLDYSELISVENQNLDKLYQTNLKLFKNKLKAENIYDNDLLLNKQFDFEFKNYIYFNLLDEIFDKFKVEYLNKEVVNRTVKLSKKGKEIDITDYDDLFEQIENDVEVNDLKAEVFIPHKIEKGTIKVSSSKPPSQSTNSIQNSLPNSDIGFIGEKYAYEVLKKMYDKVEWKSEYAIKAGFPNGKDGFGYDFECTKNGVVRFLEIKSTTTSNNSFHISKKEIKIGHDNSSNFDILLITNLLSDSIQFKYLENIFQYEKEDNFFENKGFSVENDAYKIKFK
jgi:hypothetical protein